MTVRRMSFPSLHVLPLHAGNPGPMTGSGNWTYLVPGTAAVLIDGGVGATGHLDEVWRHAPGGPAVVAVTHAHSDHASGAPALAARAPAARFLKHPWPERDRLVPVPWQPLADGDVVETPEGPIVAVHTPGHSPDHLAFWHAASRTVFTGDLLVLGSSVVIPGSGGGSLVAYLASLRRIADLEPVRALPAHGPVIDDPRSLVAQYVAHRLAREAQVLDALAAGAATPASIAARVYDRLAPALVPMAHQSVLAHLVKLEEEGRAAHEAGAWRLVR